MRVYLDHNSTTPLRPEVRERFLELLDAGLGNASGTHASGRRSRAVVDEARERVAAALRVPEDWVVFTSGGTEANNHALRGSFAFSERPASLVIGATEHSSVLETALELEREGVQLSQWAVNRDGTVELGQLPSILATPHLRLLSVMVANNETGALLPVDALAEQLAALDPKKRPLWHMDAVQALGRIPLHLRDWGVDMASFSAHKVAGPLGIGLLVRRPQIGLPALLHGGGQEAGARSGTENVPGIGAAALAVELAVQEQPATARKLLAQSSEFWERVHAEFPAAQLIGPALDRPRLPNTLNILFKGIDGRALVARLDLEGLEASLGSACSSGAIEASHVLVAMGYEPQEARAGLRLSLGSQTSHKDIHRAGDILGKVMQSLLSTRRASS